MPKAEVNWALSVFSGSFDTQGGVLYGLKSCYGIRPDGQPSVLLAEVRAGPRTSQPASRPPPASSLCPSAGNGRWSGGRRGIERLHGPHVDTAIRGAGGDGGILDNGPHLHLDLTPKRGPEAIVRRRSGGLMRRMLGMPGSSHSRQQNPLDVLANILPNDLSELRHGWRARRTG